MDALGTEELNREKHHTIRANLLAQALPSALLELLRLLLSFRAKTNRFFSGLQQKCSKIHEIP